MHKYCNLSPSVTLCLLGIKAHAGHRHMLCYPPLCFQTAWDKVQQCLSLFNQYQLSHGALHSSEAFNVQTMLQLIACSLSSSPLLATSPCSPQFLLVLPCFFSLCWSVTLTSPSFKLFITLHWTAPDKLYHCAEFWSVWNAAWMLHHLYLHLTMWWWAPSQALWTALAVPLGKAVLWFTVNCLGVQAGMVPLAAAKPTHNQ